LKEWTTPDFPKHVLNCRPKRRRDRGRPRKRWQHVDAGTGQETLIHGGRWWWSWDILRVGRHNTAIERGKMR